MKKTIIILCVVALLIAGIITCMMLTKNNLNSSNETIETGISIPLETAEDLQKLIEMVYEKSGNDMFGLETRELDLSDEMGLTAYTGLTSNEGLDKVVVSESMITSTAYSVAVVKVADGADVEKIKEDMVNNVDVRRWICVCADVVYATNHDNVIFLVMASEENAKPQYDAFKEVVNNKIGKELTREAEPLEF